MVAPAASLAQGSGVPAEASREPTGRVIDQVVAVIEGQVLTRSELEFETRVALVQQGALQASFAPLDDEALKDGLEMAINLRLQVLSADRLEAFPTEQAEVEARLGRFRASFEGEEAFQRFLVRSGADLKLLAEVLERRVRAERILDSRVQPRAQVSEAEVLRYYQQHASEYPEGYAAVKIRLQNQLKKERYDQFAAKDLAELRDAAQVRRVASFAREAWR
ncbi:hypothetical protein [Hyalangium sp.]|uniref:hypothetical protein n=1 Tax=Hyalangium sp. TaxID=2028555 RepID=UPI002D549ED3|nr:hypothetical protein [Hyalangium sp.]HYH95997.1 hypothetical protein [Hyalangium sp.]